MTEGASRFASRLEALRRETLALYYAYRDPRVSLAARIIAVLVVAYALSPIDLIPDFVPVLGYLDDLVLVPLGVHLALRLIPPVVIADARARAASGLQQDSPTMRAGVFIVAALWLLGLVLVAWVLWRAVH